MIIAHGVHGAGAGRRPGGRPADGYLRHGSHSLRDGNRAVPFEGDSALSVAYKHKNEIPPSPRNLNAEIPEPFNKLILTCLEKEKDNRYQTAEELLADLIRIEEGLSIAERVASRRADHPDRPGKAHGRETTLGPRHGCACPGPRRVAYFTRLPKKPTTAPAPPRVNLDRRAQFREYQRRPGARVWATGMTKLLSMGLQESSSSGFWTRTALWHPEKAQTR